MCRVRNEWEPKVWTVISTEERLVKIADVISTVARDVLEDIEIYSSACSEGFWKSARVANSPQAALTALFENIQPRPGSWATPYLSSRSALFEVLRKKEESFSGLLF